MPELPDVEVFRRRAEEHALERTAETVSLRPEGMLKDTSKSSLREALRGHSLRETHRHGKHLFLRSGERRGRWLRLHFGMTGSLLVLDEGSERPDHVRLRLDFRDGASLAFRCPRKFGEIGLIEDPGRFVEEQKLGPDPFARGFGLRRFRECLEDRSGGVKAALMNQEILAGLGNVYTDEVLFQSGRHPEAPVEDLDRDAVAGLWRALDRVLEKSVDYQADVERMPSTWLLPNREDGAGCPRCGGTIRESKVSGRTTYHCSRHQRRK